MKILIKTTKKLLLILIPILLTTLMVSCRAPWNSQTPFSETDFVLDTVCTITVGNCDTASEAVSKSFELVRSIQRNIDYYDSNSTISKFNNADANTPVKLDDNSFSIISTALEVSASSDGAFDITVAPISELWDFKSENPIPPHNEKIEENLKYVGYDKLNLDTINKTLSKSMNGVKIDLGSCGKGYACQAVTEMISKEYPSAYAIIDFGGNVSVIGNNPKNSDGHFTVGIQEPFSENGKYSQTVNVNSGQTVVTSGTYQRHFYYSGKNYHHILNPTNGMPAESGISSVSIIGDSSTLADCLSTACLVMGKEDGTKLAEKYNVKSIWIDE